MRKSVPSLSNSPTVKVLIVPCPGHYLFIEASRPQTPGDRAVLQSQTFPAAAGRCLTFWYHMLGAGIGTLSVSMVTLPGNASSRALWSLSGNQQDQWRYAQVPVASGGRRYRLLLQGSVGSSYLGDLAVDDLAFTTSACPRESMPMIFFFFSPAFLHRRGSVCDRFSIPPPLLGQPRSIFVGYKCMLVIFVFP